MPEKYPHAFQFLFMMFIFRFVPNASVINYEGNAGSGNKTETGLIIENQLKYTEEPVTC